MHMFQISRFAATFSNTGVILGLGFFCASLTPSLLPRVFTMQGVLSGVAFATGYGIGKVLYWLYRYMELKDIPENSARIVNRVLISSLLAVTVFTLSRTLVWQNSVRIQMEMEAINYVYPLAVLPVAVLTALAVILLMRLLLHAGKKAVALVNRYMPRRISIVIGSIAFMLLVSSFVDKIILKAALHVMDKSFAATNRLLDEAYEPPRDSLASGGSGSLIFGRISVEMENALLPTDPSRRTSPRSPGEMPGRPSGSMRDSTPGRPYRNGPGLHWRSSNAWTDSSGRS